MPEIAPPGGAVNWPSDEGAIGVVGVAPWATLDFCRALYAEIRAAKDWHFPRVLLDINSKIPSRGRHLQLGETDPSPAIAATIRELAAQGANVAVVVCNTAHIVYDRWAPGSPIPVPHIVREAVAQAANQGSRRVTPLVSSSLAEYDLYGLAVEQAHLECRRLDSEQQRVVGDLIEQIKVQGALDPTHQDDARRLLSSLRQEGVDTVLAGCTELSSVAQLCTALGLKVVDSNVALARAALAHIRLPSDRRRSG